MWFGCHPLRADFFKRRLLGQTDHFQQSYGIQVSVEPIHDHAFKGIVFCHRTLILINSNGNSRFKCWQFL